MTVLSVLKRIWLLISISENSTVGTQILFICSLNPEGTPRWQKLTTYITLLEWGKVVMFLIDHSKRYLLFLMFSPHPLNWGFRICLLRSSPVHPMSCQLDDIRGTEDKQNIWWHVKNHQFKGRGLLMLEMRTEWWGCVKLPFFSI